MRNVTFASLLVFVCTMIAVGCGGSEPTVIQPTAEMEQELQSEPAAAEAELETTNQ